MSEDHNRANPHQTTFECVDGNPEYIDGESPSTNGNLFYFQRAVCPNMGVPCPTYYGDRELTCVVCTK